MKIIEASEVFEKLTMRICLDLMEEALKDFSSGKSMQQLRTNNVLPHGNLLMLMPAYLGDDDFFGAKVISAFNGNIGTEYPTHSGAIMLFDSKYGELKAIVDATSITQIRTGAVSGVATKLLAREDAHHLALIGAGMQARSHLEAMLIVRDITQVTVYDINLEAAESFAKEMNEKFRVPIQVCSTIKEAVEKADIICCVSLGKEPYLEAEWVQDGTHINAVGAYSETTREVTSEIVAKSRFYADSIVSIMSECGEFLIPKAEGLIDDSHIIGEIGQVALNRVPGRQSEEEITLFDALGLAVEDMACAKYLYCLSQE
jgi:ornithine cyclodeaminase/alanine dehydrogenase-like protein (mu-crystallin family)